MTLSYFVTFTSTLWTWLKGAHPCTSSSGPRDRSLLIGWFLLRLSDFSFVGYITDHGRILYQTKPNANTAVCHWIMIWCSFLLTKIDVMMCIVQDRWGLLADENRESLGAVNCVVRPRWHRIFLKEKELKMAKYLILLHRPFADEQGKTA